MGVSSALLLTVCDNHLLVHVYHLYPIALGTVIGIAAHRYFLVGHQPLGFLKSVLLCRISRTEVRPAAAGVVVVSTEYHISVAHRRGHHPAWSSGVLHGHISTG